jgi:hypothetical protein
MTIIKTKEVVKEICGEDILITSVRGYIYIEWGKTVVTNIKFSISSSLLLDNDGFLSYLIFYFLIENNYFIDVSGGCLQMLNVNIHFSEGIYFCSFFLHFLESPGDSTFIHISNKAEEVIFTNCKFEGLENLYKLLINFIFFLFRTKRHF